MLNVLKNHCKNVSRDYDTVGKSFFASVLIAETEDELEKLLAERAKLRNLSLEEYRKSIGNGVFFGTPEVIKERFSEKIKQGFDYFQIMFPYPRDYEQSIKFAQLVIPKFR
ncbi:MAG: hypothetical protein ACXADY_13000 [Candidatus Hodarchaeales archaeon]